MRWEPTRRSLTALPAVRLQVLSVHGHCAVKRALLTLIPTIITAADDDGPRRLAAGAPRSSPRGQRLRIQARNPKRQDSRSYVRHVGVRVALAVGVGTHPCEGAVGGRWIAGSRTATHS